MNRGVNNKNVSIPINNQFDVQFLLYIFISILYMFRATLRSSSGESVVSIQHLVYVTLCRGPSGMRVGKGRNSPDSPDDKHKVARNMSRIEINIYINGIVRQVGYYLLELYRDARSPEYIKKRTFTWFRSAKM